jgi:hypothetical protein
MSVLYRFKSCPNIGYGFTFTIAAFMLSCRAFRLIAERLSALVCAKLVHPLICRVTCAVEGRSGRFRLTVCGLKRQACA